MTPGGTDVGNRGNDVVARLQSLLETMVRSVGGLRGVIIADRFGLPVIGHRFKDPSTGAAMATFAFTAAERLATNLQLPGTQGILIEGDSWKVLVQAIGNGFSVLYLLDADANLGFAKLYVDKWRVELSELLSASD